MYPLEWIPLEATGVLWIIVRLFNFVIVADNGFAVAVVAVFVVVAADIIAIDVVVFCVILKRGKGL